MHCPLQEGRVTYASSTMFKNIFVLHEDQSGSLQQMLQILIRYPVPRGYLEGMVIKIPEPLPSRDFLSLLELRSTFSLGTHLITSG